jgi:hypothetical protein
VIPPSVLAGAHDRVIDALEMASRAAQLLSNGSRFHNANAVCEGQSMLAASRERRLSALKSMRRYLVTVVQPAPASAEPELSASGVTLAGDVVETASTSAAPETEVVASGPLGEAGAAVAGERDRAAHESATYDPLLDVESLPPAPLADPDAPPPSFLRSDPDGEPSASEQLAPAAELVVERGAAPPVAATEAASAQVLTSDVPPTQAGQSTIPAEPRPRGSNWGSLFGRPPDQPPS